MGPDLELKSKSENINTPAFSGQKVLEPGKNYGGDACDMEMIPIEKAPVCSGDACGMEMIPIEKDVEVNITSCTNSGKALVVQDSCEEVTESSSSFGDTGSGTENADAASFSDPEVESRMCADSASSSMYDDWSESLRARKKGMTLHWRRFISPLMWRCKWIELQLKKLQSQALKYDKELEAYNYTKQLDFAHLTLDGTGIKSVPISGRMYRNKVMKRNKRKRVEERCDLASYMSNHSLFSYYEEADCNVDAGSKDCHGDAIGSDTDNGNMVEFKLNDLWSSVDHDDNDKSLDDIIQKIEAIQSQVQKLKTRYDKVISDNPGKFCSVNQSSMLGPSDGLNHSDLKPASFAGNKNTYPVNFTQSLSHLQSEFSMGDLLMPGNASSGHEGIIPHIEATDMPELDDPQEDTKDEVLIQNQVAKEELHDLENVGNQLVKNTMDKAISQVQLSEPDSSEKAVHNLHSTLKSYSTLKSNIPRSKREGRKKSGSKR